MTANSPPDAVTQQIEKDYTEFRNAARNWSGVYHAFQFGTIILSAGAALVLKLHGHSTESLNDWGAILAATSALFGTILTTGRFKEKWEANRLAAFAVRDQRYEIEKTDPDLNAILASLQRIGLTRNNAIIGLPPSTKPVG